MNRRKDYLENTVVRLLNERGKMSINLEKAYFKKLEEYVGKKLNIVSNENEITIIYDVETSYVLQEEKEIFLFLLHTKE